jgi:hypothetical protein
MALAAASCAVDRLKIIHLPRPNGAYDIADHGGWVSVGIDHDVASLRSIPVPGGGRWDTTHATRLLVTPDCGGSNRMRLPLWKRELQTSPLNSVSRSWSRLAPANGTRTNIACSRSSTGVLSRSFAARPSFKLIAATTTDAGLKVQCEIDSGRGGGAESE